MEGMGVRICFIVLCLDAVTTNSFIDWLENQYEIARIGFVRGIYSTSSKSTETPRNRSSSEKFSKKFQDVVGSEVPFPCDTNGPGARSPIRPISVHKLRPGDIDVIGAMGDSLTAASGGAATKLAELYIENRGISWSIGGERSWREYLTLPNILKEFNPNLVGFSLMDSLGFQRAAQFNVAEPIGIVSDMPFQARLLVRRIRSDRRVNFQKDWKMVTILIGGNDFCSLMCYYNNISMVPEMHKRNLMEALDWLRANLPRTLVNLVPPPNLRALLQLTNKPPLCYLTHKAECPCLFGERWKHRKEEFIRIMTAVQKVEMEIAKYSHYSNQDDFAVVLQPFLIHADLPRRVTATRAKTPDYSFLSEDCFHFSQKLLAVGANSIWNNLLEPVGNKTQAALSFPFEKFLCPTEEQPYIFTAVNSRYHQ